MFDLSINFSKNNIKITKITISINFVITICFQHFESHNIMIKKSKIML